MDSTAMDAPAPEDEPASSDTTVIKDAHRREQKEREHAADDEPTGIYRRPMLDPASPETDTVTLDTLKPKEPAPGEPASEEPS